MDSETRQKLIDVMYEVIREENLPQPNRILIRHPTQGGHRSAGTTLKMRSTGGNLRITITISSPLYVLDPNGRFHDRKNKNIKYRYEGWQEVSKEKIIFTAAHEMAHLKFWNHGPEHQSYTTHLLEKLSKLLEDWNNDKQRSGI